MKKLFTIFTSILVFFITFPSIVFATTNYGDGTYNGGDYNVGDTPTPAPTSVPSTTSSSSTSSNGASVCNDMATIGSPDLFEIRISKNSATLYFAPPVMPYSNFYVAYSRKTNVWEYGTQYNQGYSPGVLQYTINSLNPNTKYYFRIRSGNGCATGGWGNTMTATTTLGQTRTYYKNLTTAIVHQAQATITNIVSPIKKLINNFMPSQKTTPPPTPETITQTQTQPQISVQPTPKPKFCFLWWCF